MIKITNSFQITHNLAMAMAAVLLMIFIAPVASAQAVRHSSNFNHMQTGFPLTGGHTNVECETCHVGGVFRGTPTDCAGCHSSGRRIVAPAKTANHLVTNAPCERCHTNSVTFLGAKFDHMGVQPKACTTCHNGGIGSGKPSGHVATTAVCDTCHRTSTWIPASFNHVGVTPGTCLTCHGVTSTGKPSGHMTTTLSCDSCHLRTAWTPASFHVGVTVCKTCHDSTSGFSYPGIEQRQLGSHEGSTTLQDCISCHASSFSFWNEP